MTHRRLPFPSNELLYYATEESNRIEQEPVKGRSFDNHWRATLLARTAAEEFTLLHPRVIHQLLFEGLPMKQDLQAIVQPGDYRPPGVNTYVQQEAGRVHAFPEGREVEALMREWWTQWWMSRHYGNPDFDSDLVRWWFHAWFEAIHPFADGNGRVGRLLWWNMTMLAGQKIEVTGSGDEERYAYYDRLEAWRRDYCNAEHMNPFR
jgi:Fic family protein